MNWRLRAHRAVSGLIVAAILALTGGSVHAQNYTLTTVDVPGASVTAVLDINNSGQMVGLYTSGGVTSGFIDTSGDHPGPTSQSP